MRFNKNKKHNESKSRLFSNNLVKGYKWLVLVRRDINDRIKWSKEDHN